MIKTALISIVGWLAAILLGTALVFFLSPEAEKGFDLKVEIQPE